MKDTNKRTFEQIMLALLGLSVFLTVTGPERVLAETVPRETQRKLMAVGAPFVPNQGQMDKQVRFFARTFSGSVYVTDQGRTVYQLPARKDGNRSGWVLVEETENSLPVRDIRGEQESQTKVSFFTGNDPSKWHSGLSTYESVNLGEIYEGITLRLRAWGGSVEKFYHVVPGGDPQEIRIRIHGAESLAVNDQGEMEVRTGNGPVIFSRPRAYQQAGDRREEIEVAYQVDGRSYGFTVGRYDRGRELIIDPLIQSTYLGGGFPDNAYSLAVSGGYVYVAGSTGSTDFPGTIGGAQTTSGGGMEDAYVAKLSANLKQLIQATYLGGENSDSARALVISGEYVYVAGHTYSTNFPGTAYGGQPVHGGGDSDAFITKLNLGLTQLVQSTYIGGSGYDFSHALAVSGDYVYVAGETYSPDLPGTSGGAQSDPGGGNNDSFVSKFNLNLTQLVQSTYVGGSNNSSALALAVSGDAVYIAGKTGSSDFPGTSGGAQNLFGGGTYDAFLAKLSTDLTQLVQSTYLGGSGYDSANALAVSAGNIYVAGETGSANFPGTAGGAQPAGSDDAFVAKLTTDLTQFVQSTYLGGTAGDTANALALSGDYVYVAGSTSSTDFPGTGKGAQPAFGGIKDAFLSKLNGNLTQLIQSTYLGGTNLEEAYSLAVSGDNVYVVGQTNSTDLPGTTGGAQPAKGAYEDAFVSLLSSDLKQETATGVFYVIPNKKGGGSVIYLE
ncbi:MAG: Beta-propeller repeat protein [Syntrophus sp. PtaB.Bin138]|nr:MAG: Beta-propeller repeat protein [Syntrophus sp. PtaB.Bin138]